MSANHTARCNQFATEARYESLAEQLTKVRAEDVKAEPGPCAECPYVDRCGSQGLACEQFAIFAKYGGSERWRSAPRQPSSAIFGRLFR